jgi:hypothetical protein
MQLFDDAGLPLAGGKLYFYQPNMVHGPANLKTVFTDSTGLTNHANPVVLDSAGRAEVWLEGIYDVVCNNANATSPSTLWSIANIVGIPVSTDVQSGAQNWGTDTGTTDAFVVALNPEITAYTNGLVVRFIAGSGNSGNATLTAGGNAANIRFMGSTALSAGLIEAQQTVEVVYNGPAGAWDMVGSERQFLGARVGKSVESAVPHNTMTLVPWDIVEFDTSNFFSTTVNTTNLSIPSSGVDKCMMTFNVSFTNAINAASMHIGTSNSGVSAYYGFPGASQVANVNPVKISMQLFDGPVSVKGGDTFFCKVFQTSGSTQNINVASWASIWAVR